MKTVRGLEDRFGIHHSTIQIETGAEECPLALTTVV
jgi:hypothetical protein